MSERNILDEGSSTVRWSNAENFGSVNGVPLVPANDPAHEVNEAWHPRIPRYDSYVQNTDRLGVAGALQLRPSDATSIDLDVLLSKSETTRDEAFIQAALNNNSFVAATNISNYVIRDDAIVAADFTNARLLSERRHDEKLRGTGRQGRASEREGVVVVHAPKRLFAAGFRLSRPEAAEDVRGRPPGELGFEPLEGDNALFDLGERASFRTSHERRHALDRRAAGGSPWQEPATAIE